MTMLCSLSILAARFGFIRGHCGKVANKAPPGRATGASAKAAILPQPRAVLQRSVHLRNHGSRRAVLFSRHPPASNHEPCARRLPMAVVVPCSFSTNCRPVLLTSKEVLITIIRTPVLGHVGLRWVVPVPGIPALPLTRHCQVVWGLCPMTVSRKRTCQLRLSGGQKH